MSRPFKKIGFIGATVIAMSIILLAVFPSTGSKLPEGFFTPIIAFEFIQTKVEVFQMFVQIDGTIRREMVDAMNLGNQLDYIYMVLYSLFLFLFCLKCAKLSENKFYFIGTLISLAILAGDAMENMQLLGITSGIESGDFDRHLNFLYLFTWVKWGGIAAVFLVLIPWFAKGGKFSKTIGMTGSVTAALGVLAFINRSVITEIFCLGVGLMFLFMIIYCFTFSADEIV